MEESQRLLARHLAISLSNKMTGIFDTVDLPEHGRLIHLRWMCEEIFLNFDCKSWPVSKLHRWIGFIQACLMFHGISSVDEQIWLVQHMKEFYPE